MKKLAFILAAAVAILCSCTKEKTLVVYYSQTGNTKAVAELFAEKLDADVLELQCEVPYPDDFMQTVAQAGEEVPARAGRALVNGKADLSGYGRIYVGFPIWCGTFASPIVTFIRENDLAGKDVVLFCTYGNGNEGSSESDFKELCPEANVLKLFGMPGRLVSENGEKEVSSFLADLGVK